MLTGRRFKLKERTLAIEVLAGERKAVSIPAGTILKAVPGATRSGQTIDILWDDRKLEIFACDVNMRGTVIIEPQGFNAGAAERLFPSDRFAETDQPSSWTLSDSPSARPDPEPASPDRRKQSSSAAAPAAPNARSLPSPTPPEVDRPEQTQASIPIEPDSLPPALVPSLRPPRRATR